MVNLTSVQQAAQDLVNKISYMGASPLDWPEYTALEDALEAEQAQAVEPVAWLVRWRPAKHEPRDINPWVALSIAEYRSNPSREERPLFTHPAPPPYDQQALELCDKCGWKAIMPGDPCFVCNMQTKAQQVAVPLTQDEIIDAFCKTPDCRQHVSAFKAGVKYAEAHHEIGAKP